MLTRYLPLTACCHSSLMLFPLKGRSPSPSRRVSLSGSTCPPGDSPPFGPGRIPRRQKWGCHRNCQLGPTELGTESKGCDIDIHFRVKEHVLWFRSLWTTPLWWQYWTADASCQKVLPASSPIMRPWSHRYLTCPF